MAQSAELPPPLAGKMPDENSLPEEPSWRMLTVPPGSWLWLTGVLAVGLVVGLGLLYLLGRVARPLALVVLGITVASALTPLVSWLCRWLTRVLAVLLVYTVLLLIVAAMGAVVVPALVNQAEQVVSLAPTVARQVQNWLQGIGWLHQVNMIDLLTSQIAKVGTGLLALPLAIFSSLFDIVVIFFISLYWLIVAPSMHCFGLSLFPKERWPALEGLFVEMGGAMGGYIRGTAINGAIVAALSYAGYSIIGVSYPLVLALLAGLFEFIPTLGPMLSGIIAIGVALLQSPAKALIVLIFAVVLQELENHVLVPNVMRSQTNTSPLLVIVALLIGTTLGGLIGALVAIPLAGALQAFVTRVVAPEVRRWTGAPPSATSVRGTRKR
jgi:predicted PurR-regulated permease PerM